MTGRNTYAYGPVSGSRPRKAVLMLHGLGSNGQDLISLAPAMAKEMPDIIFLSPDAPQDYDMAPPGFGYQWFSLRSFEHDYMLEGARSAEPALNAYIDQMLGQIDLQDSDLALLGFSQGTMMSLFAATRRKAAVAGVLGYSGALLGGDDLSLPQVPKPPVFLVHGDADDVVPVTLYHQSRRDLAAAGFKVDGIVSQGLAHGIDDDGIKAGTNFLKSILG